jgi:hypothetical protein
LPPLLPVMKAWQPRQLPSDDEPRRPPLLAGGGRFSRCFRRALAGVNRVPTRMVRYVACPTFALLLTVLKRWANINSSPAANRSGTVSDRAVALAPSAAEQTMRAQQLSAEVTKPSATASENKWLPRLAEGIPPSSIRAVGVAAFCFGGALALQIAVRWVGGSVMFATYFPAVLVAGLLAGLPAGALWPSRRY